jgi:hypothetical protein
MKLWRVLLAAVASAGIVVCGTGPANASPETYIAYLKQHAPALVSKYGSQALIKEGHTICNAVVMGSDEEDVADMVQRDFPAATRADGYTVWEASKRLCLDEIG